MSDLQTQLANKRALESAGQGAATQPNPVTAIATAHVVNQRAAEERTLDKELKAAPVEQVAKVAAIGRTFVHQVAGANTIMPDGKKLNFYGKTAQASKGISSGFGYYTTDQADEIKWLESLVKDRGSQVTELLRDLVAHTEKLLPKPADPTIAEAQHDAARNSERAMDPTASNAVDNLGKTIAMNS